MVPHAHHPVMAPPVVLFMTLFATFLVAALLTASASLFFLFFFLLFPFGLASHFVLFVWHLSPPLTTVFVTNCILIQFYRAEHVFGEPLAATESVGIDPVMDVIAAPLALDQSGVFQYL